MMARSSNVIFSAGVRSAASNTGGPTANRISSVRRRNCIMVVNTLAGVSALSVLGNRSCALQLQSPCLSRIADQTHSAYALIGGQSRNAKTQGAARHLSARLARPLLWPIRGAQGLDSECPDASRHPIGRQIAGLRQPQHVADRESDHGPNRFLDSNRIIQGRHVTRRRLLGGRRRFAVALTDLRRDLSRRLPLEATIQYGRCCCVQVCATTL